MDLNEITFIDKSGERLLRFLVEEGAQCIATDGYSKHVLAKLTTKGKGSVFNRLTGFFFAAAVAVFAVLIGGTTSQSTVPSGSASDQVLRSSLRDASMALRCNLGPIESGENVKIARRQWLLALSNLLPQVSAGAPESVQQVSLATLGPTGLKVPAIPTVIGPFGYSSVALTQPLV